MQRAGFPEREPGLHTKDAPELEGGNQLTEQECSFRIQTLSDGSILPRPRSPPPQEIPYTNIAMQSSAQSETES